MNRLAIFALLGSVSALALIAGSARAAALPSGGHYVSGKGEIGKAGQSLTVKQSSTTGIIDWNKFSIGSKNAVTFDNGSGATLNRVTGGNLSTIAGSLHATGSLYLMNSNGVIVSGTGRIVTGGNFAASTGDISSSGDHRFKPGVGNVVNHGSIVADGTAALAGANVRNTGTIHAEQVNLDVQRKLYDAGSITAQKTDGTGGYVNAHAHSIVIGASGIIDTSSASQNGGTIRLVARSTTTVDGTLKAEGESAGGFIETSGERVHVANGAKISTLATKGKTGTWLIDPQDFTIAASGGDITGAALSGELASNDVTIKNSQGVESGNGDIFVDDTVSWTSGTTLTLDAFHSIAINSVISATPVTARGGLTLQINDGGTGGEATQSAAITVPILDLLGTGGSYMLTDASNSIGTLTANTGSIDLTSSGDLTIGAAGGNAAIASGALTITTGGNLALNAGAVGTTVDLVSAGTITEQGPGGGIEAGTLTGSAGGAVKLNVFNEVTDLGNFSTRGHAFSLQNEDYDLTTTGTINVGGAALRLTTSGGFPNNIAVDSKLEAGTVDLVSTAKITESTAGDIDATTLTGSADAAVSLTSSSNTFTDLGPFSTSGNHPFKFTDDHTLTVDGAVDAGSGILDLTTVGSDNDLIIHSAITGGTVNLVTTGEATENSSGAIKATDLLNVTANTGIYLPSHKNRIKAVGTRTTNSGPNKITL